MRASCIYEYFGLDALPFELSPDPKYLMMTPRHREALANLQYGISARKSLTLMTGEAGTGKTTLVNAALASPPCKDARIVQLSNSTLTRDEFVEFLARSFRLSAEAGKLEDRCCWPSSNSSCSSGGHRAITTALVIDEAQCLERELLEEIRMLSNIETPSREAPAARAGRPAGVCRAAEPAVDAAAEAARRAPVRAGNAHRGGNRRLRGGSHADRRRRGVNHVHPRARSRRSTSGSGGIPRTISVICDNAMVNGFALGIKPITAELIQEVCADFDLGRNAAGRSSGSAREAQPARRD